MSDAPQFDPPPQQPERQSKRAQLGSLWHNSFTRDKTPEPVAAEVPEQIPEPVVQPEEPEPERVSKRAQLGSLFQSAFSREKTPEPVVEQSRDVVPAQVPEQIPEPAEQSEETEEPERLGKRAQLSSLLAVGWEKGKIVAGEQLVKGTLSLEHSLGLGKKPNVIPPGEATIDGDHRTVEIGWHPVAGMGGKWLAEKSGLGKMITKEIGRYPDPTQHWGVLVGNYVHQLWMDENLDVIYFNEELKREDWRTFEVGKTRFTDEALRQAGEMVIHNMREKRAAYNIISNNCQNFATMLLDAIQIGAHHEFATSFAVYQRATGDGAIKDLFVDKHPEEQKTDIGGELGGNPDDPGATKLHRADTVSNAQQVMAENTTQLDNHGPGF